MSDDDRHPIDALAEAFVARHRRGERPTIEGFCREYPEHAASIRALFPTMLAIEGVALEARESSQCGSAHAMPSAAAGAPALERLGDFRIIGELGRGGMGIVYEAEQESLHRRVAVKVLPRQAVLDHARQERFHQEARTAARLHHTNIVPVFGTGEDDGHHYFVMQLIGGLGLDRLLATLRGDDAAAPTSESQIPRDRAAALVALRDPEPGGIPAQELTQAYFRRVAELGLEIAEALDYAHDQGVLHRDIKPANLILDAEGRCWVTDFGLAKALEQEDLTGSGDLVGTLRYLAPESLRGKADARSDLFSLGLTLYELLTLQPARAGGHRGEMLDAARIDPEPIRRRQPQLPVDLATVVTKACASDPADRYPTAAALASDLRAFLAGRPVAARRISRLQTAWRWCRRNPALASVGSIAVLALVAAGLTGWLANLWTSRALQDAVAENRRADRNLQLSLDAFDDVFASLCGPDLALTILEDEETGEFSVGGQGALRPSDVELLERLLAFYQEFAAANADSDTLALDSARAWRRLGDIQRRLGDLDAAENASREALAQLGSMAGAPPLEVALAHNNLGRVALERGDRQAALEHHRSAQATLEPWTSDPTAAFELAQTHNLLGIALQRRSGQDRSGDNRPAQRNDDRAAANEAHRAALAILADLRAGAQADRPTLQFLEAQTQLYLADALPRGSRGEGATLRAEAMAKLRELVERHPEQDAYAVALIESLLQAQQFARRVRIGPDTAAAETWAGRLAETWAGRLAEVEPTAEALVRRNPQVDEYRSLLTRVQFALGLLGGDPATARSRALSVIADAVTDPPARNARGSRFALASALQALRRNRPDTDAGWRATIRVLGPASERLAERRVPGMFRTQLLQELAAAQRAVGDTEAAAASEREADEARSRRPGRRR